MGKRKKITIIYNGFHGLKEISFLVPADAKPGDEVEVSSVVARRLNKAVCGIADCKCYERVAHKDGQVWKITLPREGMIMRGHYPQD